MRRYRGKRKNNIFLLVILVLCVTIGYAILSTSLNITGLAGINKNTWDIHWNRTSVNVSEGSVSGTDPRVFGTNDNTVEFTTELELPGDFYEFTVDAINEGSIDGAITLTTNNVYEVVNEEEISTELPDYILYTVTYDDDTIPTIGDILKKGESKKYKVRVEYDSEATSIPDTAKTYKFKYTVTYGQYKRDPNAPYKIKFNANGGTVDPTTKDVEKGEAIGELPVPVKGTSPFLGWYENIPEAIKITEEFIPQDDMILYARWSNDYTTFDIGQNVVAKFKQLAGNSSATYGSNDTNISSIQRSTTAPIDGTITEVVSASGQEEILAWYDNGTIYWYTTAEDVFLNEDASYMFYNLKGLNDIDLSFYTNNTTNMSFMFSGVVINELNLSSFDTSKVENMNGMFSSTNIQTLNVSSFNTKNVTDMSAMFAGSFTSTIDVSNFNTSKVTNLSSMFASSRATSLDLSSFDVSKVTNFGGVFGGCNARQINISNWNFASVTSLSNFFSGASNAETIIFENVNTSNIVDMSNMFGGCMSLISLDLSSFDTHNVTNMNMMFAGASSLQSITVSDDFVVDQVTTSNAMFGGCNSLRGGLGTPYDSAYIDKTRAHYDWGEINPGYFNSKLLNPVTITFDPNGGSVSPTQIMLEKDSKIPNLPIPTRSGYAFTGWYTLTDGGTKIDSDYIVQNSLKLYAQWNKIEAMFDVGRNVNAKFKALAGDNTGSSDPYIVVDTNITEIRKSATEPTDANKTSEHIISSSISNVPIYAWYDNGIIYWWTEANVAYTHYDASYMFYNLTSVTSIDTSSIDTSITLYMSDLFAECSSLTSIDVSNFNTSSVQNMNYMFSYTGLTNLDVNNFNTSNVTDMSYMFSGSKQLQELDLSNFDTSKISSTGLDSIFSQTLSLEKINMSNWNFKNYNYSALLISKLSVTAATKEIILDNAIFGTTMDRAFYELNYLEKISLKNVDTSRVTDMQYMFFDDYKLQELDLSDFDTSNVTNMQYMIGYNKELTSINVTGFDMKNVTNIKDMFVQCESLTSIDTSSWDTSNIQIMELVFSNCKSLEYLNISNWSFESLNQGSYSLYYSLGLSDVYTPNLKTIIANNVIFPANMELAFYNIPNLERISLSNVDTSNVTNMYGLFQNDRKIRVLSLTSFDTSNVTNMDTMFGWMSSLTTIFVGDGFVVDQVDTHTNMFVESPNIKGGNGTEWDEDYIDKTRAHFDGGTSNPGYFQRGGEGNYVVTLNPNGGTVVPTSFDVFSGASLGELPIPSKEGFKFDGWYLGNTIDGLLVDFDYVPTSDITLVAKWRNYNNYTVTLNPNGGTVEPNSIQVVEDNRIGELPNAIFNKHEFDGWYTEIIGGIKVTEEYIPTANVELYAHWLNIYDIEFDANGGQVSELSREVVENSEVGELPVAVKTGNYKFEGWYYDNLRVDYKYKSESNMILKAKYKEVSAPDNFADDDWDVITSIAQKDSLCSVYNLGDTKEVDLGEFGVHTVRIANCSKPNNWNNKSQSAYGNVIEFVDIITLHRMNNDVKINGERGIRNWTTYHYNKNSKYSDGRSYLNTIIYDSLPNDLKNNIIDTYVVSNGGYGMDWPGSKPVATSYDKLYLLDMKEIYGEIDDELVANVNNAAFYNRQLDYYESLGVTTSNNSNTIKKYNGVDEIWWTRTAASAWSSGSSGIGWNTSFFGVKGDYSCDISGADDIGLSPAFRIG